MPSICWSGYSVWGQVQGYIGCLDQTELSISLLTLNLHVLLALSCALKEPWLYYCPLCLRVSRRRQTGRDPWEQRSFSRLQSNLPVGCNNDLPSLSSTRHGPAKVFMFKEMEMTDDSPDELICSQESQSCSPRAKLLIILAGCLLKISFCIEE